MRSLTFIGLWVEGLSNNEEWPARSVNFGQVTTECGPCRCPWWWSNFIDYWVRRKHKLATCAFFSDIDVNLVKLFLMPAILISMDGVRKGYLFENMCKTSAWQALFWVAGFPGFDARSFLLSCNMSPFWVWVHSALVIFDRWDCAFCRNDTEGWHGHLHF